MPISPGTRIGPYEVVAPLGAGGMGEVYRARDSKLGRDVALKVLPARLANDADYMTRFQREAQVLASLNHPNIASIYGLEENAIVMELVEGQTLAERASNRAIPIEEALPFARQIVEALAAAHEKGITHRDLKPANVKITPEGMVKVLDFGLAKVMETARAADSDSPTLTLRSTEAGWILGTAGYMSPEQARGHLVDRRTDIWAFGAVFYEMLSGKQTFAGETVTDLLASVVKTEPDWSALPANTPRAIERLLRLCLVKDRRQRLQAIGDARIFLDEESAPAAHAPRRHWIPWTVAGVLAIGTVIALFAPWRTRPVESDRPLIQLDLDIGDEVSQPAISPDGLEVAFVARKQLAVRRLNQTKIVRLAGTEGASYPFFSPDGHWMAFFSSGKLRKIAIDGGAAVALCDAPLGRVAVGERSAISRRL